MNSQNATFTAAGWTVDRLAQAIHEVLAPHEWACDPPVDFLEGLSLLAIHRTLTHERRIEINFIEHEGGFLLQAAPLMVTALLRKKPLASEGDVLELARLLHQGLGAAGCEGFRWRWDEVPGPGDPAEPQPPL